jgi:nanoRNase/pAp phosphatase (c-di-AMP/oligoRNAs hydrolase)
MFRFKILAGHGQFDGSALGIAFALQAALQELDKEREFMGGAQK